MAVQPGCGEPGYASDLEEGLDWVLEKHLAQPEPRKPGIVSMSLIISKQSSSAELISEKVEELIENGIIVVAAAGNFHEGAFILLLSIVYLRMPEERWHNLTLLRVLLQIAVTTSHPVCLVLSLWQLLMSHTMPPRHSLGLGATMALVSTSGHQVSTS